MLAAAVVYSGAFSLANLGDSAEPEQGSHAKQSTPDRKSGQSVGGTAVKGAALSVDGYVPTFFDGRGGVAGVQLTEEQRQAVITMAIARGMSEEEAHELAYGSDETERHDDEGAYVWADGTPLRHLSPVEEAAHKTTPAAGTERDNGAGSSPSTTGKGADSRLKEQKGKPDRSDASTTGEAKKTKPEEKAKKGVADILKESVEEVVPDPVEDVVEELRLRPFLSFVAEISKPGTKPSFKVQDIDTDGDSDAEAVQITATTQVSKTVMMTANVVAPLGDSSVVPTSTIAVTLTDLTTNEVIVAPDSTVVDDPAGVSQTAIAAIVDAVTEAGETQALPDLSAVESAAVETPQVSQR